DDEHPVQVLGPVLRHLPDDHRAAPAGSGPTDEGGGDDRRRPPDHPAADHQERRVVDGDHHVVRGGDRAEVRDEGDGQERWGGRHPDVQPVRREGAGAASGQTVEPVEGDRGNHDDDGCGDHHHRLSPPACVHFLGPDRRYGRLMDRRQFLRRTGAAGAALGSAAILGPLASGCGDATTSTTSSGPTTTSTAPPPTTTGAVSPADWSALGTSLSGSLVLPSSPTYTVAKEDYNERFDGVDPKAIAYCQSPTDVQ